MSTDTTKRAVFWSLLGICAVALALRVYGIAFGLPDIHHPDESPILNRALAFAKGSPKPANFLYPTLYLYLLFAWETLFFVVGRIIGLYHSVADFQRGFFVDPTRVVVAGRLLAAVFGTLTVAAVYRFGARLYDRTTGVCAAVFLAVAPLAVRDAHYIKMDVPVTLFVVLTLGVLAGIVTSHEAPKPRTWIIAGLFAGLACSTQYYGVVVVVPIVLVAIDAAWRFGDWRLAIRALIAGGIATFMGFVIGSPFFFFDLSQVSKDFAELRKVDMDRAVSAGAFTSFGPYLTILWRDAFDKVLLAVAAIGLIYAFAVNKRRAMLLLGFLVPFFVFLANSFPVSRYLNPIIPILCVAAAVPVVAIAKARRSEAIGWGLALAAMLAVPPLAANIRTDRFLKQADTRTLAREFVERTVPAGATVLIQPHSVQLRPSRDGLLEALRTHLGADAVPSDKFRAQLALDPYPSPAYRTLFLGDGGFDVDKIYVSPSELVSDPVARLRALGVTYVVLTRYNGANQAFAPLEAALDREGRALATFAPYRADATAAEREATPPFFHNTADVIGPALERPGPTITIWQLN